MTSTQGNESRAGEAKARGTTYLGPMGPQGGSRGWEARSAAAYAEHPR